MTPPETRYARSGDVRIAYQVVGNGPFDLVFVPGYVSNMDLYWEGPAWSDFFSRLVLFSTNPVRQARHRAVGPHGRSSDPRRAHRKCARSHGCGAKRKRRAEWCMG